MLFCNIKWKSATFCKKKKKSLVSLPDVQATFAKSVPKTQEFDYSRKNKRINFDL